MRWLVLLCRLAVGATFCFAAVDKLQNPGAFAAAIHNYRLLPVSLLHGAALLLPMVEAVIGVALIVGWQRRGAALFAAFLTTVFIAAIATALVRGLDISCGCFHTDGGHAVGTSLLVRDFLLLAACLPPILRRDSGPELDRFLGQ